MSGRHEKLDFHEWVLAACLFAVILSMVSISIWTIREGQQRRDDQIRSCERGNKVRVALNALIASHPHSKQTAGLPIVDCAATIR